MTRLPFISRALGITALVLVCSLLCPARDENGSRFEANGVTIYYEVSGSGNGTPLVAVNGGPGFDHTYLHLSPAWDSLAKNRRVVFYDQRGVGRSTLAPSGKTFTLKDQIDDLEALRAHLGAERIDLLGHSWGGFLVMAYAARFPQHISHLLIMDSAAPAFKDTIFLSMTYSRKPLTGRRQLRLPTIWATKPPVTPACANISPCSSTRPRSETLSSTIYPPRCTKKRSTRQWLPM